MSDAGPFNLFFWTALQLRHFFTTLQSPQRFNCPLTTCEHYCSDEGILSQVISKAYVLLHLAESEAQTNNRPYGS